MPAAHLPAEKVADDVWSVPVPLPRLAEGMERFQWVNCYLIGGGRWALVDTGMTTPEGIGALERALAAIGIGWRDVDFILITHHHPDHYGTSRRLRELCDAEVLVHRAEVDFLFELLWARPAEFVALHGGPRLDSSLRELIRLSGFEPAAPDRYLEDGMTLDLGGRPLRVLQTPGHSPGHCCFFLQDDRVLLTGDHLLPEITPHIGLFPAGDRNPLASFLASLERIRKEPVNLCLPGHGKPFRNVHALIDSLVIHHEQRLSTVLAAAGKEPRTAWNISLDVFGNVTGFHRMAAVLETLAHLAYAESQGRASREAGSGVVRWTA